MNKKDLAEEYALEEYASVNGENDLIFEDNRCFTFEDLKAAFNAGRESVVENMPELEWKDNDIAIEEEFAFCPVGRYEVTRWDELFEIWRNSLFLGYRPSLSEAKQAANEDYKQRIKQALGV
jgi:hypothetical protein